MWRHVVNSGHVGVNLSHVISYWHYANCHPQCSTSLCEVSSRRFLVCSPVLKIAPQQPCGRCGCLTTIKKGLSDEEQVNYSSRWWIILSEPRFCLTPPVSAVCCAADNSWGLVKLGHRELKQRRRGQQQERQKSNRLRLAKNNFARVSRFFVHFFAVNARLWRETSQFSRFLADVDTRQRLSFSFPELWFSPLELNSRNVCQHLTN